MYIPSFNKFTDPQDAINFMQRYSFATIITAPNGIPEATHLPFLVKQEDEKVILLSHFAKANPQAADIADNTCLVIFTEPHAYISPKHYEKEENVPTWNYLAVHAYGKATLIDSDKDKLQLLEQTVNFYEADYLKQWNSLTDDYKLKMIKGIVAFKIEVTDLQAKKKLSQNRTENERENIINSLGNSTDQNEKDIADYMVRLKH